MYHDLHEWYLRGKKRLMASDDFEVGKMRHREIAIP